MTVGRISQAAGEVLLQGVPAARPTQQAAEFLLLAIAWARGGQQAMEVLRSVADGDGTASNRPPILLVSVCE